MSVNKAAQAMIRMAAEKGIDDIRENPARGIRNLVDLGVMFANGRFQQDFFQKAQAELTNPQSAYYQLVARIARENEPGRLVNFGLNLIYHGWTLGARQIRELEEAEGCNIPWALLYELESWPHFDAALPAKTIAQGKELGIYCHFFTLGPDFPALDTLLSLLAQEQDCAFFLFLPPQLLLPHIPAIAAAGNILPVFDCDAAAAAGQEAARLLRAQGCLFGASSRRPVSGADELHARLERLAGLEIPFLFLLRQNESPLFTVGGNPLLRQVRTTLRAPVLPVDLYDDIALADGNISNEACVVKIGADGHVLAYQESGRESRSKQTLLESSLLQLFRALLPKQARAIIDSALKHIPPPLL